MTKKAENSNTPLQPSLDIAGVSGSNIKNEKWEDYKENLSNFNLWEFFKSWKPFAMPFIILFSPLFFIAWILWICICTGGYLAEISIKD